MLKQQSRLLTKLSITLDFFTIIAAFYLSHFILHDLLHHLGAWQQYSWSMLVFIPTIQFLLFYSGMYSSLRTKSVAKVATALLKVHLIGGMFFTSFIYMIDPHGFSRLLSATFVITSMVLLIVVKTSVKQILTYYRRKGYNIRHILIVGNSEKAFVFSRLIQKHSDWGLQIAGHISLCSDENTKTTRDSKELGDISQLDDICKKMPIDEVVFSLEQHQLHLIDEHISALHEMGITVRMVLDLFDLPTSRKEITLFHGEVPILTLYGKTFDAEKLLLKRCLDVIGSVVGLGITALAIPVVAFANTLESPGPLFFGQERVGENGRRFRCWKFRSMYVDAEERKKELMAHNEMQGAMFKMKDDPRVTSVGRFIRKTSIDELPQFWNVFKGEMSLVGTRPPTPDEVDEYENWHHKRICIKPGITGLWQVSGRNRIQDFDEVVKLDIRYIEEWSIWLDVKILFQTVWVVIARKGAV